MPTAIVYAYLPDGFVIGADGRRTDLKSGQLVVSDDTQKIFSRTREGTKLTFAWSGATTFAKLGFGFNDLTDRVLLDMDFSSLTTFSDFLFKFSHDMSAMLLRMFLPFGSLRPNEWDTQPPQVIFLVYFKDEPFVAELLLIPAKLTFDITKSVCHSNTGRCFDVFTGSKAAHDKFNPENQIPAFDSIREAASQIRDYIRLCFVYPDNPNVTNPIGGRIHIGQLKSNGFLWIDSPLL
jgi:hypothetical protein